MPGGTPKRLLVCEGVEDKYFFERLIQTYDLPRFIVIEVGGNSNFASGLNKFRFEQTALFNSLTDILIVADNDDKPDDSFENVCRHIEKVFGVGTRPAAELQPVARAATRRAEIKVLMIPWEKEEGHLEKLCIPSARDADKTIGDNVDTFMSLIHADRWKNECRTAKAWLRINLAARASDPFVFLGEAISAQKYSALIPAKHTSFKQIVRVLEGYR